MPNVPKPSNYTGSDSDFTVLRSGDGHLAYCIGPMSANPYNPREDSMSGPASDICMYPEGPDEVVRGDQVY